MITMEHGLLQACFMFHVRDVILLRFRFLLGLSHFDLVLLFDTGEGLMLFDDDIGLATLNKETSISSPSSSSISLKSSTSWFCMSSLEKSFSNC